MGILKVGIEAAKSVLADQWRESFYCDSLVSDVLVAKGARKQTKLGYNKGNDNIISNGSIVIVNEGQCMIIVDQGAIVDICAEAGEYIYDVSSEPSVFYGNLKESVIQSFKQYGKRVSLAGETDRKSVV